MPSLEDLITEALTSARNDAELARSLVESGALEQIVRLGTYDDATVQKRLDYASEAGMRAAVSKARRGKGAFPLPILDGRRWSRASVDRYRKDRRRSTTSTTSTAPNASSTTNSSSTSTRSITSFTSDTGTASLTSGTGASAPLGVQRPGPDQWRNHE